MRKKKFLVADLLCGAGGSSTGCRRALDEIGVEMELVCVNHWGVAIETHRLNHPEARHYCQDIASVRPHQVVPEGRLDLLMASPSCTHHSVARGGKPTSDQQRSDPWHIVTWLTELEVDRIIIENVWEFTGWGPVDPKTMRPIPARKGDYFRQWTGTLRGLGYDIEWRKLNAADYGDATTRQRFILMGRKNRPGRRAVAIQWPQRTHMKAEPGKLDLFPGLKPWRPAREIIDWSLKGKSIFDRKKPLAPKTLMRIHAGAVKFGWPEPFLVILRNHMAAQGLERPLPALTAGGTHIGLAEPVIVNMKGKSTASGAGEPLPTQTAHAPHFFSAEPVIMNGRKGNRPKGVEGAPVPTLDTKGGVWLAEPIVLSQNNSGAPRQAGEPLPTITTGGASSEKRQGCARPMLVEPFVATVAHGNDAKERDPNSRRANSVDAPLGTVHGDGVAYAVVEPFMLSRQSEGAPRAAAEPMPTQTAQHSPVLVTAYYGANEGCKPVAEPLDTITTQDRFGIVVPVTHGGGEDRAHGVAEPLPTVTCAQRGELAFIAAQFGEREGQAPRVHGIENPTPTIAATGHVNLVEGVEGAGREYDILFRMLEPHELAAAMGFDDDAIRYEFAGTKTEQVKQIGNAVSVAKMKACVSALCADAAPKKRAKPEAARAERKAG